MRSRILLPAVCGALAIACVNTSIAMVDRTSRQLAAGMLIDHTRQGMPSASTRAQADSRSWWSAFEDPVLDRLMAASLGSNAQAGIAATYIALKVNARESSYLENAHAAVSRQMALMKDAKLPYDDFAKQLAQRQSDAQATIEKLQAQRASYIAYLARRCSTSEEALGEMLSDALQDRSLPRFAAKVPRELPMTVLANRSDIRLAAALYGADPMAMPSGTIGEAQDVDVRAEPRYASAIGQAREQIAEALRRLQIRSDIADTASTHAEMARASFEASKLRRDRGEISEVQLMEDFQRLLLDLHAMAVARGELAVAWIVLMGNMGGGAASMDAIAAPRSAQAEQTPWTGRIRPSPFLHEVSRKLRNP